MPVAVRTIAFFTFLLLMCTSAIAQSPIARANLEADIENLEQEIADLELFAQMKSAADYIPDQSRCMTYLEMAAGYRDELQVLNQQYAGRADAAYRERAETLLDYNKRAIEEYESCFGSVAAQRYDKIRDAYVYPYDTFRARYNVLSDWFGENTNLAARLGELQRELEELKLQLRDIEERGDHIGTITATFRDVKITRGNTTFDATRDTQIYVNDIITTGPRARARIEINDRIESTNAGPTVLNVGSNSRVLMEAYNQRFERLEQNRQANRGIVQLIRGTIRAATQNWGSGSAFSVRTGTSICGIRGTEVLIEYDDATKISRHWLLHGTADLDLGSVSRRLKPMHMVETPSEGPIKERPFGSSEYEAASLGEDGNFASPATLEEARLSTTHHIRRFLDALVTGDYGVASIYIVDDETRQDIQSLLDEPDELQEYLADMNVPLEWELGCVTCLGTDFCTAKVAVRETDTPEKVNHYEWVMRPYGDLWRIDETFDLDLLNYNNANLNCPN